MRARLDRGPHGVPRGCQLSGQSCNDGCLEAQLSDRQRIARTPKRARGAHTFSLCSRSATVWQVRARHIQRRIVPPDSHRDPSPRARRSPPLPRARDREQVTPQPGQPAQRSQGSLLSTRPHSHRVAATRWKPSKSTSRSHRSQRSQRPSDTEHQQVG